LCNSPGIQQRGTCSDKGHNRYSQKGHFQLPQSEFHSHFNDHVHRLAAPSSRAEAPLTHSGNSALIEASSTTLQNGDITDRAVALHNDFEHHVARDTAAPRFIRVFRLHLAQKSRWVDAAARPERSATSSTAGPVADPGTASFAAAYSLTRSRATTSAGALALPRRFAALHDALLIAVAARCGDDGCDQNA
jgi:hypothetical protein